MKIRVVKNVLSMEGRILLMLTLHCISGDAIGCSVNASVMDSPIVMTGAENALIR